MVKTDKIPNAKRPYIKRSNSFCTYESIKLKADNKKNDFGVEKGGFLKFYDQNDPYIKTESSL